MKNIFQILKIRHLAKKCRKCVGRFAHILDYDDDILSENQKDNLKKIIGEGEKILAEKNAEEMKKFIDSTDEKISGIGYPCTGNENP